MVTNNPGSPDYKIHTHQVYATLDKISLTNFLIPKSRYSQGSSGVPKIEFIISYQPQALDHNSGYHDVAKKIPTTTFTSYKLFMKLACKALPE